MCVVSYSYIKLNIGENELSIIHKVWVKRNLPVGNKTPGKVKLVQKGEPRRRGRELLSSPGVNGGRHGGGQSSKGGKEQTGKSLGGGVSCRRR